MNLIVSLIISIFQDRQRNHQQESIGLSDTDLETERPPLKK